MVTYGTVAHMAKQGVVCRHYRGEGKFRAAMISWENCRRRNLSLAKFRGVGSAVKVPLALHSVAPWFWGKCLQQRILSDVVHFSGCFQWPFDLHIFLPLNGAWVCT